MCVNVSVQVCELGGAEISYTMEPIWRGPGSGGVSFSSSSRIPRAVCDGWAPCDQGIGGGGVGRGGGANWTDARAEKTDVNEALCGNECARTPTQSHALRGQSTLDLYLGL